MDMLVFGVGVGVGDYGKALSSRRAETEPRPGSEGSQPAF